MELDLIARRNLELCETMRTKEKKGTLLWVLDHTRTAMGSRLIRQWIEKPLYNPLHIARRQQAVGALCDDVIARHGIDGRTQAGVRYGAPGWARSIRHANAVIACVVGGNFLPAGDQNAGCSVRTGYARELTGKVDLLEDIRALVEQAIVDEPPILLREGGHDPQGLQRGD